MKRLSFLLVVLLAVLAGSAWAQDQQVENLDDLLKRVQDGRATDEAVQRQREAEFRAARDQQQQLLADARTRLRDAERLSERLSERGCR